MALSSPLDPARVREIAGFLSAPGALSGRPPSCRDRAVWERFAAAEPAAWERIAAQAAEYLAAPTPELTDAQYLESRRTGGRDGYPARAEDRRIRVTLFTLAEALENRGRFLPALNREIAAICAERIWVMPPHDWNKLNFEGLRIDNDLISAMTAWTLATSDAMMGEGLEPEVRQALRGRIRQTVTGPFLAAIRGLREEEWWARNPYNWNTVLHAGIVGAALLLDDYSSEERAEMIASVERAMPAYLAGFLADGYSTEGMGYWRYGFGHFALLAEAILAATGGCVSLYPSEHARFVARFAERFEMVRSTHFYPPFADARFPEPPAPWLAHVLACRYGFGGGEKASRVPIPEGDFAQGFFSSFLHAWGIVLGFDPGLAAPWTGSGAELPAHSLRDWFGENHILVSRLAEKECGLAVAVKGGRNGVSHGHNDLGTFVVTAGEVPLLVDPGCTDYGAGTFGPNRFENQTMGSYGHPVPLVAGQWQGTGDAFYSTVTETEFTDAADTLRLNLAPAYPVPALRKLERRFVFERAAGGVLTVSDRFEFDSPQPFGVALVTYGEARREGADAWIVSQGGESVRVEIETGGLPYAVGDEVLRDRSRVGAVRRLGIDLVVPAVAGKITLRITPGVSSPA